MAKRNLAFDIWRLISCIFVVFIHCEFPGDAGHYVVMVGRYAVPFFLMLSGYYCTPSSVKKRLLSAICMTIVSIGLYTIINSWLSLYRGKEMFWWFTKAQDSDMLYRFLMYNRAHFFASTVYYLLMLIYVYVIVALLCRFSLLTKAYFLIPVLLLRNLWLNYSGAEWFYAGNWLYTGLPFFLLGSLFKEKGIGLKHTNWIVSFCAVMTLVEAYVIKPNQFLTIGSLGLSAAVLLWCIEHPNAGIPGLAKWCRLLSMPVFIVHCGVRDVLKTVYKVQGSDVPIMALMFSLGIAGMFATVQQLSKNKIHHAGKRIK